jgi:hypothetical protein
MEWIDTWLNQPKIKAELGANPDRKFESCNMAINQAFLMQGDSMHNTPLLLPDLINDGIRLLVYAGNAGSLPLFLSIDNILIFLVYRHDVQLHRKSYLPFPSVTFILTLSRRVTNDGSRQWSTTSTKNLPQLRQSLGTPSSRVSWQAQCAQLVVTATLRGMSPM